ncbi:DUF3592 domain-containing protein [Enterobacteriaceae bacterium BIT-l23]|uniref:DUF3592 domain-containing protein n=1 Tax=Jejubacter sp. L23 TaxID=3092086 RepID=UPI001585BB52|nr:DUF3592 domain-containing protein [Enterobacteriaceae bacterium BIT-l23]
MSNAFIITMVVIALIFGAFPMVRFLYTNVYPYLKDGFVQDSVLKNGITASAEIINTYQTSSWSGNKPIYKLTFRFETKDNDVVESTIMKALTFKEIDNLKEGAVTAIKYDPNNPNKIALYDKPLILGD